MRVATRLVPSSMRMVMVAAALCMVVVAVLLRDFTGRCAGSGVALTVPFAALVIVIVVVMMVMMAVSMVAVLLF